MAAHTPGRVVFAGVFGAALQLVGKARGVVLLGEVGVLSSPFVAVARRDAEGVPVVVVAGPRVLTHLPALPGRAW